jgi:hypothetical protein
MQPRFVGASIAIFLAASSFSVFSASQPIPVSYLVRLVSATVYDTRSRDEDTIHAALAVFVNGQSKGVSVWDGKGWDGSRSEGRRWVTGLHLFGLPAEPTVQVSTGRLQDTDSVQIVFEILNLSSAPSMAMLEAATARIQQSGCAGGEAASAWDCLAPEADKLLEGWPIVSCDGLVAADKLVYTAMQLRRKTETGDTVTVTSNYRGADAPAACGSSIYGAVVTIARQ